MLMFLFSVALVVFFSKSFSMVLSLILLEVISFLFLFSVSLSSVFVGPFVYLGVFSLFVLLAVTGVLLYFAFTRFYGRDYLNLVSLL